MGQIQTAALYPGKIRLVLQRKAGGKWKKNLVNSIGEECLYEVVYSQENAC